MTWIFNVHARKRLGRRRRWEALQVELSSLEDERTFYEHTSPPSANKILFKIHVKSISLTFMAIDDCSFCYEDKLLSFEFISSASWDVSMAIRWIDQHGKSSTEAPRDKVKAIKFTLEDDIDDSRHYFEESFMTEISHLKKQFLYFSNRRIFDRSDEFLIW